MVNYQFNDTIENAMNVMFKECDIPEDRIAELKSYIPKEKIENEMYPISHRIIKEVSDNLLKKYPGEEGDKYRFNNLIKSSKMILLSPKPRVKSPELLKILDRIKREQENKEYIKLTRDSFEDDEERIGDIAKVAKKQITLIFNVLLSIAAAFTAGFYFSKSISPDIGMRVLFGFLVGGVVGVAEGWFMTKDLLSLEDDDDTYNQYSDMQIDNSFTKYKDEKSFTPQIKNNKISKPKDNKKTV